MATETPINSHHHFTEEGLKTEVDKAEQALAKSNDDLAQCQKKLNRATADVKTAEDVAKRAEELVKIAKTKRANYYQLQLLSARLDANPTSTDLMKAPKPGAVARAIGVLRWIWAVLTWFSKESPKKE